MAAISLVCGAAAWKGGPSERFGAAVFYGAWILTMLVRDDGVGRPQYGIFIVDSLLFVLLLALALRSRRYWPLFMAGFELLAVVTHAGRFIDNQIGAWAYHSAGQIWGYLMLAALGAGTWNRWREVRDRPVAPAGHHP
jgi:hypothetical protein